MSSACATTFNLCVVEATETPSQFIEASRWLAEPHVIGPYRSVEVDASAAFLELKTLLDGFAPHLAECERHLPDLCASVGNRVVVADWWQGGRPWPPCPSEHQLIVRLRRKVGRPD